MTDLEYVIKGYENLDSEDQEKLKKYINKRPFTTQAGLESLNESLRISLGPVSTTCACCGR